MNENLHGGLKWFHKGYNNINQGWFKF